MLELILMCAAITNANQMASQLEGSDGTILLMDAHRFGVRPEEARAEYFRAMKHRTVMEKDVQSWNGRDGYEAWCQEVRQRIRAWDCLSDALSKTVNPQTRLKCLYQLRETIGYEAFAYGEMPEPIPHYNR